MKVRARRLDLGMTADEYVRRVRRLPVDIESVDAALWLDSVALDWGHRDPVDRLVVALSRRRSVDLVTSDAVIRAWHGGVLW